MKVFTVFGTRPEIIRLSRVIASLDRFCDQTLVHTGQNFDPSLSDVFFRELGVRAPDFQLGVQGATFAEQAAQILIRTSDVLQKLRPDRVLILGDTNSGLASIVAARLRIPIFHMEAGNRAYDDRIPEEVNRRIIDHCSTILMPYTHRSKEALIREGIERRRIFVTGNPIFEVLTHYAPQIDASGILERLGLQAGAFFLVTLHRAENVDEVSRLASFVAALSALAERHGKPVVVSVHPRTAEKLRSFGIAAESKRVMLLAPLGFFDFVKLEKSAACVLSDSGTVQEECCIFRVPNVTLRDVTERPETIECGSNIISGSEPDAILRAVDIATQSVDWTAVEEYLVPSVSKTVTKIVLGYVQSIDGR